MMNQIYSNKGDKLKGRQLPIMYSDKAHGFFSISGNLGTQFPQAVGWAMAAAIKGDSRIAMGWIGDGATAEGDFHSRDDLRRGLQRARSSSRWSTTSGRSRASRASPAPSARPSPSARSAMASPGLRVDGNDALAVYAAVHWAAERARSNDGPTLIEFFTYRAEGHSTSDDPTGYRPTNEAKAWPLGDPIERLKAHLIALGEWDEERHAAMTAECDADGPRRAEGIREARHPARSRARTTSASMFDDVYAEVPWHLAEQRDAGAERGRRLMPTMNMIQALNDAHKVMMRARRGHRRVRRGHRLFRRRLPRHRGAAEGIRQDPRVRRADQRRRHRRHRGRHGRLRPQAGDRDPVRRLHLSRLRPDRQRGRQDALSHRRRMDRCRWSSARPMAAASSAARPTASRPESLFTHIAGLKVVIPSTPYDAKGLLIAAIEDPDPVIFFEPKRIYNGPFDGHHDRPVKPWSKHPASEVPEGHYTVPLGKAAVVREGDDADHPRLRHDGPRRARRGRGAGPRRRGDRPAHARPARHRDDRAIGREDRPLPGRRRRRRAPAASAPSCRALVQERCFYHLEAPVERVTGWDTPYPHAYEWAYFPGPKRMKNALEKVMAD